MDQESRSLGTLFRVYRKEAGITQPGLAEAAGVSDRAIRSLETAGYGSADFRRLVLTALNRLRVAEGDAALRLRNDHGRQTLEVVPCGWLQLPTKPWLSSLHGPGALLTADYRVVPFHGASSEAERDRLVAWCRNPPRLGIRIYHGQGGMGKTRLAIELCHALLDRKTGDSWTTGFAQLKDFPEHSDPWEALPDLSKPLLIVVDYAGEPRKTQLVTQLLVHLDSCHAPRVRLLLLERDDQWLDRLHENRAAREILLGPLLSKAGDDVAHQVAPVAATFGERVNSFRAATKAFNQKLGLKAPLEPAVSLSGKLYDTVLFMHSTALLAMDGTVPQRRDAILRHLLAREREYWRRRMDALGLSVELLPAVESAACAISRQDGVSDLPEALKLLRRAPLLRDQTEVVRVQIARLLRECYPEGPTGIGPLRPDELKRILLSRFVLVG